MHDGRTRRVAPDPGLLRREWLERYSASLVVLSGPAAGLEHTLDQHRMLVGRSPRANVRIDDLSVSSEHAAIEMHSEGFGLRDLASTNGVRVNGSDALSCELKNGDEIEIGAVRLRYVVEPRLGRAPTPALDAAGAPGSPDDDAA